MYGYDYLVWKEARDLANRIEALLNDAARIKPGQEGGGDG